MSDKVTRRHFLKVAGGIAAVGATAAAIPSVAREAVIEPFVKPPEETLPGQATWYASTCRMCAAGCGIIVRTINGRAKKIEGNPEHPLNKGKLCARGQAGLQALYNPDRLRNAVQQTGGRGSREFAPVQWHDALADLLDKIESTDPQKIAFFSGLMPDNLHYLASEWLQAMGAEAPLMFDLHASMEGRLTAAMGAEKLFGTGQMPVYDIANADVIFSFGANFLETWQSPVAYSHAFGEFRQGQAGGRGFFVQFEPRMSATAASADEWVPLRPGMDGLVALALGRIIIERRLGHVGTFGQTFADLYRGVEVETLSRASGVEMETLERMANILAEADRPLIIPGGYPAEMTKGDDSYQAIQP